MLADDGLQWLTDAADIPERCQGAWRHDPHKPYLLATGRSFDVVAVDQCLGLRTLALLRCRDLPLGPVMADRSAEQVGFFLPCRSREAFTEELAGAAVSLPGGPPPFRYLGQGCYVVTPGPLATGHSRYIWLLPALQRFSPALAAAPALALALTESARATPRSDDNTLGNCAS